MFTIIRRALTAICVTALIAACSPDDTVSRARLSADPTIPRVTTPLGREFLRETPWFVNFAFDSYALDRLARTRLDDQAAWILAHPQARFLVIGHTDLMGSEDYNHRLGANRAETVVAYLVARGVAKDRLRALTSLGETDPLYAVVAPLLENRRAITLVEGTLPDDTREARRDRRPISVVAPVVITAPPEDAGDTDTDGDNGDGGDGGNGGDDGGDDNNDDNGNDDGTDGNDGDDGTDGNDGDNGDGGDESEGEDNTGDDGEDRDDDEDRDDKKDKKDKERTDAGRGNGDETGDPGKSEGRNKGGDE